MTFATSAVAVMLPVEDPDRAQKFYGESLGLVSQGIDAEGSPVFALPGGASLVLLHRPGGRHAEHTAMSFEVDDLDRSLADLEGRGVGFEDYDLPGLRTEDHVAEVPGGVRAAWFCDPDGNVLCLHQPAPVPTG